MVYPRGAVSAADPAGAAPVPSFRASALPKKPNYDFEKRKKEQDRKQKKEAKREERLQRKRANGDADDGVQEAPAEESE
jgi:hypothetical protein